MSDNTVRISGSTLAGNAFATGEGSKARVTQPSINTDPAAADTLAAALQAIADLKDQLRALSDDPDTAVRATQAGAVADALEREVTADSPRVGHIRRFLSGLTDSLTSIAAVGGAVKAVTDTVEKFLN